MFTEPSPRAAARMSLSRTVPVIVLAAIVSAGCGGGGGGGGGDNGGAGATGSAGGTGGARTVTGAPPVGTPADDDLFGEALADWEATLRQRGRQLGNKFESGALSTLNALPRAWYYDSQRVFLQAATYFGDADGAWMDYAQAAERAYEAYIQPGYGMPGYERFPHGLAMDYMRTGDTNSRTTLRKLRDEGPFANVRSSPYADSWYQQSASREIAYMIDTHAMAERAGLPRRKKALAAYVDRALRHVDIWTTGNYITDDPDWQFCQSFMAGLTASALIGYYRLTVETGDADRRVPAAIRALGNWLIANTWVEDHEPPGTAGNAPRTYGAFRYVVPATPGVGDSEPAPDINLLVAPLFGWLYRETGDVTYRTVGDKAFIGGVAFAYLVPDKAFNQNYRASFQYLQWRADGDRRWGAP